MAWGILIGVALTILTVVLAMVFGKKNFTPLSYIIIVVALVSFCFEGIKCIDAVNDKRNTTDDADNVEAIVETAIAAVTGITGYDVMNYRLGIAEATAVKAAMRFAYPKAARYLETSDLVGKPIYECKEVLRKSVMRSANNRIWEAVLWMAGIMAIACLLIVFSTNIGGGGRRGNTSTISSDDSYSPSHSDDF